MPIKYTAGTPIIEPVLYSAQNARHRWLININKSTAYFCVVVQVGRLQIELDTSYHHDKYGWNPDEISDNRMKNNGYANSKTKWCKRQLCKSTMNTHVWKLDSESCSLWYQARPFSGVCGGGGVCLERGYLDIWYLIFRGCDIWYLIFFWV